MAFTFKTILEATARSPDHRLDRLMDHVAEAALDGARGNSGAIMAQYFHGFREAVSGRRLLTAEGLAEAALKGAEAAWTAMAKPVQGTLPTVLEDFSQELGARVAAGVRDIRTLFRHGLERAQGSLANTPELLPALKQAGVVDAGAQGFVDLLEGVWAYMESGERGPSRVTDLLPSVNVPAGTFGDEAAGAHRFCTECVVEGQSIDRAALMARLEGLDASSLIVAGGPRRVRVHVHVDNPAAVFLACEEFGTIRQQKADDMDRQRGLLDHVGEVAVVFDSGGDVPPEEIERLGMHMVPVRLSFGDREYLDRVTLSSTEFYELLRSSPESPLTSQPPAQDFARIYALLTSHGYSVISVGLSQQLSGTTAAALQAAGRPEAGEVRVIDSLSASTGQGLLAMLAAEAASRGYSAIEVEALLRESIPRTRVLGIAHDLKYAVRGGRVPSWVRSLFRFLHLNPVLTATGKGKIGLGGFHVGNRADPRKLAQTALRGMRRELSYRVLIGHSDNADGAALLRREILRGHARIHSCHSTELGPALGVHLGPGGLVVGLLPEPAAPN